jgi:hypothetical protein
MILDKLSRETALPSIRISREAIVSILLGAIVALSALQFFAVWEIRLGPEYLREVALSGEPRPFVYRALLPLLARGLARAAELDPVFALEILYTLSSIFLFSSFKYLYETFSEGRSGSVFAFLGAELFFVFALHEPKIYDLATAGFWALSLALLSRRRIEAYLLLFPFMTLNRETSILFLLFFTVFFWRRIPAGLFISSLLFQLSAFILVRGFTMIHFSELPGVDYLLRPGTVLSGYLSSPLSIALLGILGALLLLILREWDRKPLEVRSFFLLLAPVLFILHFILGEAFEIRVFAEVYAAGLLLAWRR